MRVAVLNLTLGGLSGGSKKYLQRLIPRLANHKAISEMMVVVPPGFEKMPEISGIARAWNDGEHWRAFPSLRRDVRAWKPDIVFIPTARFLDCDAPVVSMVRNMEPMLPPTFNNGLVSWGKRRVGAWLAHTAADRSTRVIAVSEFVRSYLTETWSVPPAKIGVVYHGIDHARPVVEIPSKVRALAAQRFVFTAGSLLPYRGLEDIISALAELEGRVDIKLAIAGDGASSYRTHIEQLASRLKVSDRVVWLGHLDEAAMTWAYQHSAAFLMTSRVEACPNVALEAMASGARCVSTTNRPMPEFFRDTALYYEAGDGHVLAQHIETVLASSDGERVRMRAQAERRAADFSWDATVEGTVRELKLTLQAAASGARS